MRLNLLEKICFGVALVVIGVTAAYRYVLTDEQRDALQEGADILKDAAGDISESASPFFSNGPTKRQEEEAAAANRARTAKQWEAIGL